MLRVAAAGLSFLLCALQGVEAQGASATAKAFFQAHTNKQWDVMATFVDSASLQALRGVADNLLAGFAFLDPAKARKDSTSADPMAGVRRSLQGLLGSNMLSMMFARVENETALRALSNRDLMTRWFEAKSTDYMSQMGAGIANGLAVNREAQEQLLNSTENMRSMRFRWEILGEIADGANTTHVVYRLADDLPGEAGVLTFQKSGERWYIHFVDPNVQLGTMAGFAMRAAQARMLRQ